MKELWAKYAPTHESHVIWTARLQTIAGVIWMTLYVTVQVLHNDAGVLSAFTDNQALVAGSNVMIGIMYELLRRYKAGDDF